MTQKMIDDLMARNAKLQMERDALKARLSEQSEVILAAWKVLTNTPLNDMIKPGFQPLDLAKAIRREWEEVLANKDIPHYFALPDSEGSQTSIEDLIEEDFEWNTHPSGRHVVEIATARETPFGWLALWYPDDPDVDKRYGYKLCKTRAEAEKWIERLD